MEKDSTVGGQEEEIKEENKTLPSFCLEIELSKLKISMPLTKLTKKK